LRTDRQVGEAEGLKPWAYRGRSGAERANGQPPPRSYSLFRRTAKIPVAQDGRSVSVRDRESGSTGLATLPACVARSMAARSEAANTSRRYGFSTSVKPSFTTCRGARPPTAERRSPCPSPTIRTRSPSGKWLPVSGRRSPARAPSAARRRASSSNRASQCGQDARSSPSARTIWHGQPDVPRFEPFACNQAADHREPGRGHQRRIYRGVDGLLRKWLRRRNASNFYFQQGANPSITSFASSSLRSRFALSAPSGFLLSNPCCTATLRAVSKSPDAKAETTIQSDPLHPLGRSVDEEDR
jgi:hypothetical protein